MTDEDEAAWQVARAIALELASRRDVRAVAVTGSLARGDAGEGSDIDLWVLGATSGREDLVRDGYDVTLLMTDEPYARSLDCALRFEIPGARVVVDPDGVLTEIIVHAREHQGVVDAHVLSHQDNAFAYLANELRGTVSEPYALAIVREAARRAAALHVFRARGLRVPKWRHFEAVLFPNDLTVLRDVLRPRACPAEALVDAVETLAGEPSPSPEWPWPTTTQLRRYVQHARLEDAVLSVRQALPPIPETSLATVSARARAVFDLVHDVGSPAQGSEVFGRARAAALTLLPRWGADRSPGGRRLRRSLAG